MPIGNKNLNLHVYTRTYTSLNIVVIRPVYNFPLKAQKHYHRLNIKGENVHNSWSNL